MSMSKTTLQWVGGGALLIAVLVGVGIYVPKPAYFLGYEGSGSDVDGPRSEQAIELVSHQGIVGKSGPTGVKGIVRNTSGRKHGNVKVKVRFFDETGAQVGDTTARTSGLGAGREWRFEVPVVGVGVTRYEIERVTWR